MATEQASAVDDAERLILADVRLVAAELAEIDERRDEILSRRRRLFVQARDLDPPVPLKSIADAAGMDSGGVSAVLNRARRSGS